MVMLMNTLKKIGKILLIILGALVGLYIVLFIASRLMTKKVAQAEWYKDASGTTILLAHQGGEGEFPSNTKLAFEQATIAGADVLDTDVHITRDGVLVLAHDETLDYRTNGKGAIRDKTYEELKRVDFAYNWSSDGGKTYPYRGRGIGVYTLDELFKDYPTKRFGIEIKQVSTEAVHKFCASIKQARLEPRVLVSSVTQPNMDSFRSQCPTVPTSATNAEAKQFYIWQKLGLVGFYRPKFTSLQVPEKQGSLTVMDKAFAGNAHRLGLKVINWTIDTPEQAKHFIDLGADGIITSYPSRVIQSGIF